MDREDGSRDDARAEADFDVENVRSADVGLWFDRSTDEGLIINDIGTGAISRLGFREGDRIYSVNGVRVDSETDFVQTLFDTRWRSQRANVIIYRHGRPWTVYVQPSALVQEYTVVQRDPLEDWGLVLDDRYDDHVVVWRVTSRSPAYYAGFRPGDVITTFEGRRLDGRDDFVRVVQQGGIETANLDINRNRQSRRLDIDLSRLNIRGNVRTSLRPDLDAGLRIEGRAYGQIDGRPDRTQTRDMFPGSVQPGVEVRSGAIEADVRGTVQPGIGQPGLGQPRYDGGVRGNVRGGTPAGARSGSLFNRRP